MPRSASTWAWFPHSVSSRPGTHRCVSFDVQSIALHGASGAVGPPMANLSSRRVFYFGPVGSVQATARARSTPTTEEQGRSNWPCAWPPRERYRDLLAAGLPRKHCPGILPLRLPPALPPPSWSVSTLRASATFSILRAKLDAQLGNSPALRPDLAPSRTGRAGEICRLVREKPPCTKPA